MRGCRLKKGMLVESQHGVGRVLIIDNESETVLLEAQGTKQQLALSFDELEENPQLHNDSDKYY